MKLSVVIPTHHRPEPLRRCLASLAQQDLPAADFEIIVVADGPEPRPDASVQWLELPQNQGQSAARNAGANLAQAPTLLFLDDDMVAPPDLLRRHLEHQAPNRVVFGQTLDPRLAPYYQRLAQNPAPCWPDDAWLGPNCSLARSLFHQTGGFDETTFPRCGEDIDLGFRLWAAGAEFRYAPEAHVTHEDRAQRDEAAHGRAAIRLARHYPKYRGHLPLHTRRRPSAWLQGCLAEAGGRPQLKALLGPKLPVLLYHHIGEPHPNPELHSLTISPEAFRSQLRWLEEHHYTPITPSEWLAWLDKAVPLPPKPVLITFDDALTAPPVKSAVFAITQLTIWEGRPVLTPDQLADLTKQGIEIGGHTRTHADLRTLPPEALEDEVGGCAHDLNHPTAFAYPWGEYTPEVCEVVARHFPLAFTCDEGLNDLTTAPHRLRRTMVQPGDTLLDLRLRLKYGRSPLNEAKSWLAHQLRRLRKHL